MAKISASPLNFHDAGGEWQPIDNALVRSGSSLRNRANSYEVWLPSRLGSEPVRVQSGASELTFALRSAAGAPARAHGNVADYDAALPHVDVRYEAMADHVKETLLLASRAAPSRYAFDLSLGDGLRPMRQDDGSIAITDASGHLKMTIAAPFAVDASGATSTAARYGLRRAGGGWTLSLSLSRRWLNAPGRSFPITVDPSVFTGPQADCTIKSAAYTTTNDCSGAQLFAGWSTDHDRRALTSFDLSAIPPDVQVEYATLELWVRAYSGSTSSKRFYAYPLTRSWNSSATWNSYNGTSAWTTAGGDYDTAAGADWSPRIGPTGSDTDYNPGERAYWNILGIVQSWVNGTRANNGLVIADNGTHANGSVEFGASEGSDPDPAVYVSYVPRLGQVRGQSFFEQELSDRIDLKVNRQNGNLLITGEDLNVPGGTGPDLTIQRAYNSLDTAAHAFGSISWAMDQGQDFACYAAPNNDVTIKMPGGASALFDAIDAPGGGYSWVTPAVYDTTLTKDASGNLTLTDHTSQVKHHFVTAVGWTGDCYLDSVTDRNGRSILYTYDTSHRVTDITDSQGRHVGVTYAGGRVSTMTDPAGRTYSYGYDASGRLSSYTDPTAGITSYDYTSNRLTKITTPGGNVTQIVYWPTSDLRNGRVKSITRVTNVAAGTGPTTEFDYDLSAPSAPASTETDPNGHATAYVFDTVGRPTTITDALSQSETLTYTPTSNVDTYTAPGVTSGPTAELDYNGDDQLVDTTTAASGGDLATHVDYSGAPGVLGSDFLPSLVQNEQDVASGISGRGTAIDYDANGNPLSYASSSGSGSVALHYAPLSGAGASWDGKGGQLDYTIDGRGNKTTYGYDTTGNLTMITPPLNGSTTIIGPTVIGYGTSTSADRALSRRTTMTDGRGNVASYAYDGLDRVSSITYKDSAGNTKATYTYTYDHDGNLTQRVDAVTGAVTKTYGWTYDALNRVTQDSLPGGLTNTYTYDAASNLTSLTDAGGTVTYTYDAVDREKTIQEPGAPSALSYNYVDHTVAGGTPPAVQDGRKVTTTLPNGIVTTEIYDSAGRLVSTTSSTSAGTVIQSFNYDYTVGSGPSAKQRMLVSKETDKDGHWVSYSYDALDRVTAADYDVGSDYTYTYDAASNVTKRMIGTGTSTYAYNAANELCWRYSNSTTNGCASPPAGATTYTYDLDGEQTNPFSTAATYNAMRQLASIGSTSFTYAGPGQAERVVAGSTAITNNKLGVGSYANGSTIDYFTHNTSGKVVSQRRPSTASPNRRTYLLTDRLGSTRTLTDEAGTVVRRYGYDPYGDDKSPSGSWTTTTVFQFAGGEHGGTGLYHFGERYYDPANARWTQQDLLMQPENLHDANRYAYAGGDPINFADPLGASRLPAGAHGAICPRGVYIGCATGAPPPRDGFSVRKWARRICWAIAGKTLASAAIKKTVKTVGSVVTVLCAAKTFASGP